MSCRHDLAIGTCVRCYPRNPYGRTDFDRVDPGPEDNFEPNLEGPGALPASVTPCAALKERAGGDSKAARTTAETRTPVGADSDVEWTRDLGDGRLLVILPQSELPDGALARQILRDTAGRSDGDARLLAELSRRVLAHVEKALAWEARRKALEEELAELRDLADLVADADISALPPELLAVRQRWFAEQHAKEGEYIEGATLPVACPHCAAGEPSVWDDVLFHYAHPHAEGNKLKFCHAPWRERCRRCSADVGACACTSAQSATQEPSPPPPPTSMASPWKLED